MDIYFDPVIKYAYKQTMRNALESFIAKIETKIAFEILENELSHLLPQRDDSFQIMQKKSIELHEVYATNQYTEIIPNSTQHNVPAWTVFAMFFIIIPLTGNIIKERVSGTALRLRIMPGSTWNSLGSKIVVYLAVCFIQFILMLMVGVVILPLFGLAALQLGPHIPALLMLGLSIALAAAGYGIMLGNIATTPEQAATFGSVSVIILAAIGGVFVPIFMMPEMMQKFSIISPLNWGLEGFNDIFLRGSGFTHMLQWVLLLTGFGVATFWVGYGSDKANIR